MMDLINNNIKNASLSLEWIAGFFDATATIHFATTKRFVQEKPYYRIKPEVRIYKIKREILDNINKTLGVGFVTRSTQRAHDNHWAYKILGKNNLISLCNKLVPLMVVKTQQMNIMKDYLSLQKNDSTIYSYEEIKLQVEYRDRLFQVDSFYKPNRFPQKYTKEMILKDMEWLESFDIKKWKHDRNVKGGLMTRRQKEVILE